MDFFNECIIKKKRDTKDALITAAIFMAALVLMYIILIQMSTGSLVTFVPIEFVAVIFGAYFAITSLKVEFEYSVVNGDMDVDKITAQRKRKRLASVKLRDIEYFAHLDEKNVSMIKNVNSKNLINASSSMDSDNIYLAIFYNNSQKMYLLFEPTDKMIENFANYVPRSLNHTL